MSDLMTIDEVAFAGSRVGQNNLNSWYSSNAIIAGTVSETSVSGVYSWWTMSPSYFSSAATTWFVDKNGLTNYYQTINASYGVRPVISLTSDTEWLSGNGTPDSPYQVKLEN